MDFVQLQDFGLSLSLNTGPLVVIYRCFVILFRLALFNFLKIVHLY